MIIKPRVESLELQLLRSLNMRMNLTEKETNNYINLEKGFIGEQKFDEWLEPLPDNFLILNDLLLETSNTTFQIDSLVISPDAINIFEVKNYEGDLIVENENWYTRTGTEIQNPILQLKRCETLLRKLLQQFGHNHTIQVYVVFINPEFYLYQAPLDLPIIFPTQINRFMNKIKLKSLQLKDKHLKLSKQLLAMHLTDSPYKRLPNYDYEILKKGITCEHCHSLNTNYKDRMVVCYDCGHIETHKDAILRSVEEFKLLFPDKKITTSVIYDWCKSNIQKKLIQKILSTYFEQISSGRFTYFIHRDN
ncbi:nuclease-related domain-containing protein [Anaerobacillus isosaccharinicus]|uniref:NERD domain-containing protein n=1 Tax=Anaerobacillus isosaccharinicus TaxID=1532552 RepID=A0A1S2KWR9_9BACI|nr:nuclease-related domain-containing protein [Anaerobacillus isosaccharinicus]MBA5585270.1 NERD domain-containing protein [Anaerobacillus isosaccharinicus]QOY36399.1 NERD domain-containing protein [Anaerobacillus isosaccharinicus]